MHLGDELLSAYLDGELPPADAPSATAHLAACVRCAETLRAFTAFDSRLVDEPALACAAALPLLSARRDGESVEGAAAAEAHLAGCTSCRRSVLRWSAVESTLRALPAARPSARVDHAIAALGQPGRTDRVRRAALPVSAFAALIAAVLLSSLGPARESGEQAGLAPDVALVAGIQQSVLNPETGMLYVLHPGSGTVAVLDAKTLVQTSVITVGGRPTALALNPTSNTILVLDATAKTVTEIDGRLNTVTSATTLAVPGRPTSLQVDPRGNVVVTAVSTEPAADQRTGPRQAPASGGVVAVLKGDTKAVQSVKQLDVAPQLIVLEPNGRRALLISSDSTTLVDANGFAPLASAAGGVAAAFAPSGDDFAILSDRPGGAVLTFARRGGTLTIGGTPRAIIALPAGGFAVLSEVDGNGRISFVLADGSPNGSIEAPASGRDLTYDASLRQFAVVGRAGITLVPLPSTLAVLPQPFVPPPVTNTPLPTARESAPPTPSAPPTRSPATQPPSLRPETSLTPVVGTAPAAADRLAPVGGRLAWPGTYVVPAGIRFNATASDGSRLWLVDEANRVTSYDFLTGGRVPVAQLPEAANITRIVIGPGHVFLADSAGVLYLVSTDNGLLATVPLPLLRGATAITASPDDRLWLATDRLGLVSFDPRSRRVETVAVAPGLSAVASDPLGRIWVAAADRQAIDVFDPLTGRLTEIAFGHPGAVTALFVERDGTVWIGTDVGSIFTMRNGVVAAGITGAGRIAALVAGTGGQAWYVTRSVDTAAGPARGGSQALHAAVSAAGPVFDPLGRAWQADPAASSFYVTLPEALP